MNQTSTNKRIFIIAGESSGDLLGGALMESLRYFRGDTLEFYGVGGEQMQAQGLESIFPMSDIALMGFTEIIPHTIRLLSRLRETCEAALNYKPDMIITIDSPGFTFRFVKWVRSCFGKDIPCIHYVAPTVWAYKPKRAAHTAELFDHMLTLLPFEPRYFEVYGLKTTFVGHPVVDDLGMQHQPVREYKTGDVLHLALFPGSRKGEVNRLLPVFRQTIQQLSSTYPKMRVSIIVNDMVLPHIRVDDWEVEPTIVLGEQARHDAMSSAHIALAKTGTVTLEIAKYGIPMVATYKVNPLTAMAVKGLLNIPYVNLINILSGKVVIPEYMQQDCNPKALSQALKNLIEHPEQARQQAQDSMKALQHMRNPRSVLASDHAAQIVLEYCDSQELA